VVAALCVLMVLPTVALGQTAQTQNVEVNPVDCWWRTSTPSVRVGEAFTIHLTCSALETEAATAVIDRSRLGPASVQFPPFEVTGGTQSPDHLTPGRRFLQYHYDLRLIAEDFFGSDIVIPAMAIAYRIESHVQSDSAVQGREQNYEMPALTMRINSLVASDARHIRESAVPTLDDIAAREFRARMFRLVALMLFSIAGLMLAVTVLGWLRRARKGEMAAARHYVRHRIVLAGVRRELREIQETTRGGGWQLDALARALAATRIVACYLAGRTVTQREAEHVTSGELEFGRGLLSRRRIAVSSAATARSVHDNVVAPDLEDALTRLTAARYGHVETYDSSVLDEALATAMRAADRAAAKHTWIAETMRSLTGAMKGWAPRAWAR
jgi:hypothetical protein